MSDNHEDATLLTPGAAAARLGISGAALRRMAASYERVHGALPEGAAGRLWPIEAVERLGASRALMAAGRARSVQGGLEALEAGAHVSVEAPQALGRDTRTLEIIAERLGALDEIKAALHELPRLREEVAQLRTELHEARALPPTPPTSSHSRPIAFGVGSEVELMDEIGSDSRAGSGDTRDGALVRIARYLERILGRR